MPKEERDFLFKCVMWSQNPRFQKMSDASEPSTDVPETTIVPAEEMRDAILTRRTIEELFDSQYSIEEI